MSIRDDIAIYNLLQSCQQPNNKRLLIRVPVAVVSQLNPNKKYLDLFDDVAYDSDDTEDYIYLKIFPEYDIEIDLFGALTNTFSEPAVYSFTTNRQGFKATVKDRRKLIVDIIKYLADISETSSYQRYSPIKVVDFCDPEAPTEGTIKWGEIILDNQLPSLVRVGGEDYTKTDWGFTFKETGTMVYAGAPPITEIQVVGGLDPTGDIKAFSVTEDGKLVAEIEGIEEGLAKQITLQSVSIKLQTVSQTLTEITEAIATLLQELQGKTEPSDTQAIAGQVSVATLPTIAQLPTELLDGRLPVAVNFPDTQGVAIDNRTSAGNSIPATVSSTADILVSANPNRKALTIYNPLSETVYVDISNSISTSNFQVPIKRKSFYEMPSNPIFTGDIWAIVAGTGGSVNVREFV